jgi:hypothetical protein
MSKGDHITVKGIRRSEPDLRKLGKALIQLVKDEEEAKKQSGRKTNSAGSSGSEGSSQAVSS